MQNFQLTRFAPTPSGYLHLGNVYSFLITTGFAKKHGAKIMLRIDDLDQERVKRTYVEDIFNTLDFLELPFDLGPKNPNELKSEFSQLHRRPIYETALLQLKQSNRLFACDCSRRKLLKSHPKGHYLGFCRDRNLAFDQAGLAWRFKTKHEKPITLNHLIYGKKSIPLNSELHDFVIRKKNGQAAYQLSSVVDDDFYGCDLIIRGKDLWDSSHAQLLMALNLPGSKFPRNVFFHHPLLTDHKNQKLSKSQGATSIQFLRKSGKKPAEVYRLIGEMANLPQPIHDLRSFLVCFDQIYSGNPKSGIFKESI